MATVAHHIHSHYDPEDRETLERETGQISLDAEHDPWQTESSFGTARRLALAPHFVPAQLTYDEWGNVATPQSTASRDVQLTRTASNIGGWYKSLTTPNHASTSKSNSPKESTLPPPAVSKPRRVEIRDKNNWFISRVLRDDASTTPPSNTPSPSLADILARDPPPLPSEKSFVPPVFLALGPTNKGFAMLQQSGWNEGEGLGASAPRISRAVIELEGEGRTLKRPIVKKEEREIDCGMGDDVVETRKVDVIDLTLSDAEESDFSDGEDEDTKISSPSPLPSQTTHHPPSSSQTVLLTPIPTVLKSDRLGIGLKAKTVGPYKASQKRVTHNSAALAAHIRASEDMRKKKAEVGRGSRGFARVRKKEEAARCSMLAYMNEG